MDLLSIAREVIEIEAKSILDLRESIDGNFEKAIELMLRSNGRIVITGMGKSGIVGKKIAATLASTGTPSFFMHPGEAYHGDLGMLTSNDVIIAISYSGETEEVIKLIPYIQRHNIPLIAITGNKNSILSKNANHHLNAAVYMEACPLKLAPTSSTTAALVLGDAIAVALMKSKNFKAENFAEFHPGGNLGKRLLLKVRHRMVTKDLPIVEYDSSIIEIINCMTSSKVVGVSIVMKDKKVVGVITDGDIRRALRKKPEQFLNQKAIDIMGDSPVTISPDEMLIVAEEKLKENRVTSLLVMEKEELLGLLHIHDMDK
ncbi:KpsF/GutQ family sugar-phosphate isomerase [Leptospira yanagawae]|uniref:KpsF/GutQ family sugar-phosphate isomerase n=1 Tax=Leptospira yanagawae TaxID=293069 RepID=A0ABY2LWT1_9LEPT|nr:KpsF/GutQ family sugar-phosphate isomerase [Leptospira yanagawae]TGL16970.1 KpsF/GutQ family sugar-phosphate isomerase [Leptospira yanagawae]